ncbi:MAG: LacI family DNA-binding transcriptional regulator [Terracidiphilus sp.]
MGTPSGSKNEAEAQKTVDIYAVAKRARVSASTVSRVINGLQTVDAKLAARVWAAARDLDYRPNLQARSLGSGRSRLLGLIVTDVSNPFFPDLIRRFEFHAVNHGYEILIGCLSEDETSINRCLTRMLDRRVDGIAALTFGLHEPIIGHLVGKDVPVVFANFHRSLPYVTSLHVDYKSGYRQAVQHLGFLGHREIAFLAGPLDRTDTVAVERFEAFREATREIGVEVPRAWILEGDFTLESGIELTEKLLRQKNHPTAIVCTNDLGAIGVLHAVMNHGFIVPDYLSVIGFDNIPLASYTFPPLTTIEMSCDQLAVHAIEALVNKIEVRKLNVRHTVPTQLILRRTTAVPRVLKPATQASDGVRRSRSPVVGNTDAAPERATVAQRRMEPRG